MFDRFSLRPSPSTLAILGAVAFAAGAPAHVLASVNGDEGVARLEMEPVSLPRRDGSTVTVRRGRLVVPIVRAKPDSKPISIEVWQFPAAEGADPDAPPIVRLNGGPGWPGLRPSDIDYDGEIVPLTLHQDLVVVGQRGIGSSTDTSCDGMLAPTPPEATEAEKDEALVNACFTCREHWESEGFDLSGLNVIEAAADVDDVRRLLGYEQIVIWGGSFGSHWGMAVMRFHPDGVARAVLTGMEGPDHTYDMPSGVLASLERLAAAAELSSVVRPHVPEGGLIEAFKTVIARVEEKPVEVVVGGDIVRIDADDVRDMAQGYTGHVSSRQGAPTWPADIIALYNGDFDRAARALQARRGGGDELPTASFFMLDCGSGISPERLEKLRADPAAKVVGQLGRWYETACSAWDADLGAEFRSAFTTKIPTVVVQGTWDTSTPFENALECLPFFRNVRFVVVEGGSHGALGEAIRDSKAFGDAIMKFVATGDMSDVPEVVEMPPIPWAPPHRVI